MQDPLRNHGDGGGDGVVQEVEICGVVVQGVEICGGGGGGGDVEHLDEVEELV